MCQKTCRKLKEKGLNSCIVPASIMAWGCVSLPSVSKTCAGNVETIWTQTWGESTFNDSKSDRRFDSEFKSVSSQFGYDSEYDSSNISISDSDSESDSNFQLLI